eukprot:tig00020510_g9818.t1
MAEREAAPIMSLPDDLVLAVMERAAAACGTFAVLRGLASSRRRFQRLAYGESSKLFMEPAFVSGRQGPRPAGDTVLDVARLAARFGGRVERLHLRDVSFALRCAGAAEGEGEGESCAPPSSGEQPQDGAAAAAAAAGGSAGPPARADGILLEALCSCPNLTHLSFSGAGAEDAHRSLAALESLPSGFALPRLRHLDLCGHIVPLPAFRRLLGACSASLERLYLRGTRVVESAIDFSGEEGEAAREAAPYRLRGNVPIVHALDGLDFPRLASLDVSSSDDCAGADDLGGFAALRALHARLPALRDLAAVRPAL